MSLSNLILSAAGTCRYCGNRAGVLARDHPECRHTFKGGCNRMIELAAEAAISHSFDEKSLRLHIAEIARNSYGDGNTVNQALEEGWKRGVGHAMADGIITQAEETILREFRDRLALADSGADRQTTAQLNKASRDWLTLDARRAARPRSPPERPRPVTQAIGATPGAADCHSHPGLGGRGGRPRWKAPWRTDS